MFQNARAASLHWTIPRFLAITLLALPGCSDIDEELKKPLPMDQVPPEILRVAKERYPDLVFEAAYTEVEDGQPVFELKGKARSGKMLEVEITKDGKLLE